MSRQVVRREWKDCLLILLLTAIVYLPFLGLDRWDGNESLRVMIAKEMLKTGNWLVPVLQGKPYFVKPPLMNWLIAGSGYLFGTLDELAGRLPSVIAVFLMGLSVYLLTGKGLGRQGRLFAAIATVSMAGLIEKGRTAEIDAVFVFLTTLPLLVWFNGYERRWNPLFLWCVSLLLVGLGFLTKGPQSVAYFYSTVFVYLLIKKRPSFFFSMAHLAGVLSFLLVLALYLPTVLEVIPFGEYAKIVVEQVTQRAEGRRDFAFISHFVSYPFVIAATFMPWTLFAIPAIFFKEVRGVLKNELFVYCLVMIAVNFPVYWWLPGAKARHFLPAGPFTAVIAAVLFESYLKAENPAVVTFFKKFLLTTSGLALLSALSMPVVVAYMGLRFSASLIMVAFFAAAISAFILYTINSVELKRIPLSMALTVGLTVIIFLNISAQIESQSGSYPKKVAGEINLLVPEDADIVYVIGYRNLPEVMCYIEKKTVQLDEIARLKPLAGKDRVYFIFNTRHLDLGAIGEDARKVLEQEIRWEKVYSRYLEWEKGEIVVGYLKPLP